MSYKNRYDKGDWKAICDACGREFKASRLRKRWDGYMVCSEDWEPRQPQDFVKAKADIQTPSWTRPEAQDTFVAVCTPASSQGVADYGQADCARADINYGYIPVPGPNDTFGFAGLGIAGFMIASKRV
jgi:hypothetical protein